jgi:hypothetical protein
VRNQIGKGSYPAYSIGKQRRKNEIDNVLPGPSDYNIAEKHIITNGTIPRSPRNVGLLKEDTTPGPA